MKIAFVLYEGLTLLDFIGVYDPLTRLRTMGFLPDLEWDLCAFSETAADPSGLGLTPIRNPPSLAGYDLLIVPGGSGSRRLTTDQAFLAWLRTAASLPRLASVCTGALLLAAAGFLEGKYAATHPDSAQELEAMGVKYLAARLVEDGNILSAGGVTAGIDLGLHLCRQLAGDSAAKKIRRQMDYPYPFIIPVNPSSIQPNAPRASHMSRQTGETHIELTLALDGSGQHQIDTGLPFFDHMLTQVAVHGLFDLAIEAHGDLQVDPHHTIEDVGLALGMAFQEALGNRPAWYAWRLLIARWMKAWLGLPSIFPGGLMLFFRVNGTLPRWVGFQFRCSRISWKASPAPLNAICTPASLTDETITTRWKRCSRLSGAPSARPHVMILAGVGRFHPVRASSSEGAKQ